MPARLDIVGACASIRKEAETLAGQNYAYNLKKKTGALDFVTSPENGGVDMNFISYNQGKKAAKLQIFYDQRTKPCQIITDCTTNVCSPGTTPVRKEATFTINSCIKTPVRSYSNDDMIALCMDREEFIRTRMISDIRAAHEVLSVRTLAELDNQIGINLNSEGATIPAGAYKSMTLLNAARSVPNTDAWAKLEQDYQENQLEGQFAVIGQGNLDLFFKLQRWACCNGTTPYGEVNVDGLSRYYLDQNANNVLGPNNFILATFGSVHMLTFNENRDIDINDDAVAHTVIADPLGYPFDWDMDVYWDVCTKTWKIQLTLVYGFFNVFQADSFAADGEDTSPDISPDCNDDLDGMLGVFGYTAAAA